jgi:hypothetical protein
VRRRALISAVLVAAGVLVSAVGVRGLLRSGRGAPWTAAAVRAGLAPDSRPVFDLVVALQGQRGTGGADDTDWIAAEQACRALKWPRCDRPALEELKRSSRPSGADRKHPEAMAALAVADATWAFGSEDAARSMFRTELDRIPESDGPGRARVFVRFGIIDMNPDGQAALFAQACVADPSLCDRDSLQQAARREVQARFVAPGNVVPLYFGGHPSVGGIAGPR